MNINKKLSSHFSYFFFTKIDINKCSKMVDFARFFFGLTNIDFRFSKGLFLHLHCRRKSQFFWIIDCTMYSKVNIFTERRSILAVDRFFIRLPTDVWICSQSTKHSSIRKVYRLVKKQFKSFRIQYVIVYDRFQILYQQAWWDYRRKM